MAEMARPHTARRTLAALALLAAAVAGLASLGRWQLHRADERRAVRAAIEAGRSAPPLALSPGVPAEELRAWRPASAQGAWRNDLTVLVDNRNQDGRPGLWVATPLEFDQAPGHAVLVLRGWLPRPLDGGPLAVPPGPPGPQQVQGELASRVPRLFDLATLTGGQPAGLPQGWPGQPAADARAGQGARDGVGGEAGPGRGSGPAGEPPRVQNLDLDDYARATGLRMLPAVLEQGGEPGDGMRRDWPQPSVDADQNMGYAMQWFGFAAIAAAAWMAVAVRALRRRRAARAQRD